MNVRNFVIIAHVDHGKSTLADRLLEATGTVESRRMRPQYLDQLELERERGITIKMAPVRMVYHAEFRNSNIETRNKLNSDFGFRASDLSNSEFILNLIDTPGHSDFSYEVSRALAAVEGAVLLVDATKGIQAQTLSNLRAAKAAGLKIIGAVNKIDLNSPHLEDTVRTLASLLAVPENEILRISGKTGVGVEELLKKIVEVVPPPQLPRGSALDPQVSVPPRALIFDSLYDDHKGILAYVRVYDGVFRPGEELVFLAGAGKTKIKEVGYFAPELKPVKELRAGDIGYIATGLKEPALVKIGDTVIGYQKSEIRRPISDIRNLALPGYREPAPVVFISLYPDGETKFEDLKKALERLRLTDAALSFEPDSNEALGRGLKVGFLGQLHFEITATRLEREFNLSFITSFPSIAYKVRERGKEYIVTDAHQFPDDPDEVLQPMIDIEIITPPVYLNSIVNLSQVFDLSVKEIRTMGEQTVVAGVMPLMELIRDFDDQLKSVSAGYASFSYELGELAPAEVEKLEIIIANEVVPALTRIIFKKEAEREGRATVERLKDLLPKQQFAQAVQAMVRGRIIARETIPAMRKDVTGYLYGGDRSRKMKLWKKQKRGKEKLLASAKVRVPVNVFKEILKKSK